jgi:hypothetical protein
MKQPRRSEPDNLALFDMTLVLTIGLAMFELAVELLSVDTLTAAGALIAGVASWTISAHLGSFTSFAWRVSRPTPSNASGYTHLVAQGVVRGRTCLLSMP